MLNVRIDLPDHLHDSRNMAHSCSSSRAKEGNCFFSRTWVGPGTSSAICVPCICLSHRNNPTSSLDLCVHTRQETPSSMPAIYGHDLAYLYPVLVRHSTPLAATTNNSLPTAVGIPLLLHLQQLRIIRALKVLLEILLVQIGLVSARSSHTL